MNYLFILFVCPDELSSVFSVKRIKIARCCQYLDFARTFKGFYLQKQIFNFPDKLFYFDVSTFEGPP